MRKIVLIILIIILVSFIFSFGYWYFYKHLPQKEMLETPVIEEPEVIPPQITTFLGEITEISDRTLTITVDGDTLAIPIKKEAKIIVVTSSKGGDGVERPAGKEIEFKDIKAGDEVNISAREENEELIGISVLVFPKK